MSHKTPKKRRAKADQGVDLDDLYSQFLQAFYGRGDLGRASDLAERLDAELVNRPDFADSIRGEEVRSLLSELRGDFASAVQSRQAEIRKIFELHSVTQGTPGWDYIFKLYNYQDISDRLDILASLSARAGDYHEAAKLLRESKDFCASHEIPFDGDDLLEEFSSAAATAVDESSE